MYPLVLSQATASSQIRQLYLYIAGKMLTDTWGNTTLKQYIQTQSRERAEVLTVKQSQIRRHSKTAVMLALSLCGVPVSKVTTLKETTLICIISGVLSQLCYEHVFLLNTRVYLLPPNIWVALLHTNIFALSAIISTRLQPSRWWLTS